MNRLGKAMGMKRWKTDSQTTRDMENTRYSELSEVFLFCFVLFFLVLFCFTFRNEVSSIQGNIQRIKAFTQLCRCSCLSGIHVLLVLQV